MSMAIEVSDFFSVEGQRQNNKSETMGKVPIAV